MMRFIASAVLLSMAACASAQETNDIAAPVLGLRGALDRIQQGRPREALGLLRAVIREDPSNRQARVVAATALAEMDRPREAKSILDALVAQGDESVPAMNNLAWILATSKDPAVRDVPRALELARRAILITPSDFHVWSTLAECHYQGGNYDAALRAAEQALAIAQAQGVTDSRIQTYTEQVERCRNAVAAFTIIE